jgi:hypothetical protein
MRNAWFDLAQTIANMGAGIVTGTIVLFGNLIASFVALIRVDFRSHVFYSHFVACVSVAMFKRAHAQRAARAAYLRRDPEDTNVDGKCEWRGQAYSCNGVPSMSAEVGGPSAASDA